MFVFGGIFVLSGLRGVRFFVWMGTYLWLGTEGMDDKLRNYSRVTN